MWEQAILLQAVTLALLFTAHSENPIKRDVIVVKDEVTESIQISTWTERDYNGQYRVQFKASRVAGTGRLEHQVRVIQWRMSDAPGRQGYTEILENGAYNDSITMYTSEADKIYRGRDGSSWFWYVFPNGVCDGMLMLVEVNGATTEPFYMRVIPGEFRMSPCSNTRFLMLTTLTHAQVQHAPFSSVHTPTAFITHILLIAVVYTGFCVGGGSREYFFIGEIKNFAFFQTRKFSKNANKSMKIL